jgi:hypothetical protein
MSAQVSADAPSYLVEEVVGHLADSLRTVEWALARVPEKWHHRSPGGVSPVFPEGTWSTAMNLAHLAVYEERVAAPVLEALAAGADAHDAVRSAGEGWLLSESVAVSTEPLTAILDRLRAARQRQIDVIAAASEPWLNTPATPLWEWVQGTPLKSPGWVATKTFQHTWEHGHCILRIVLFAPR